MAGINQVVFEFQELTLSSPTAQHGFWMCPPGLTDQSIEWTFYFSFLTSTTAGVVKVESSHSRDYGGTWPAEATVTFTGTAPNEQVVHLTALNRALRVRISTAIADSAGVKVYAMAANKT